MADNNQDIQRQINEMNEKLDTVLHHVNQQRLKSEMVDDFMSDASIITKDAWDSTVKELEDQGVELNVDDIKQLSFKLMKNIGNFTQMIELFESFNDLAKDMGPITKEVGIDTIKKLHEFEQKGYFEFFKELAGVMDNIVANYSPEDLRELSNNVVTIMETLRGLTQPEILNAVNHAANNYKNMDKENIEEYSLWKTFRSLNSKEMKQGMGFIMTFMKELSKESNQSKSQS